MEDVDFCVLLSNLLDNAKEALEKVEGMRLIEMEVKRFQEKLYLTVSNNVADGQIDFGHTSKEDKLHHGYGVRNIRRVVEKYNGTVQWQWSLSCSYVWKSRCRQPLQRKLNNWHQCPVRLSVQGRYVIVNAILKTEYP